MFKEPPPPKPKQWAKNPPPPPMLVSPLKPPSRPRLDPGWAGKKIIAPPEVKRGGTRVLPPSGKDDWVVPRPKNRWGGSEMNKFSMGGLGALGQGCPSNYQYVRTSRGFCCNGPAKIDRSGKVVRPGPYDIHVPEQVIPLEHPGDQWIDTPNIPFDDPTSGARPFQPRVRGVNPVSRQGAEFGALVRRAGVKKKTTGFLPGWLKGGGLRGPLGPLGSAGAVAVAAAGGSSYGWLVPLVVLALGASCLRK